MLGLMIIAAAAATQEPKPVKILHLGEATNARKELYRAKANGYARVQITISPDAKLVRCDMLLSSGDALVDRLSCEPFTDGSFSAASDETGARVYGVLNVGYEAGFGDEPIVSPPHADLSVAVKHMPPGTDISVTRTATLSVDATGTVLSCYAGKDKIDAPLDKALCQIAMQRLTLKPALTETGVPVASVQSFRVEFSAEDAPLVRKERIRPPEHGIR